MKEIIQGFYQKKHSWTRLILVIAAVILMGFALSWRFSSISAPIRVPC